MDDKQNPLLYHNSLFFNTIIKFKKDHEVLRAEEFRFQPSATPMDQTVPLIKTARKLLNK